jgi:sec-independent protein translocase protein TatB
MLNVGPLELLVVLAVALIVVGPERLPELARSVGRALRQLRQVQDEVRDMVSAGVDDEMRQAASDVRKATDDVTRAAGVGELGRAGRTQGPRKTGPPAARPSRSRPSTTSSDETPAPAPDPASAPSPGSEGAPPVGEPEVAGPPADRLVEDAGAVAEPVAPRSPTADPDDRSTDEPSIER